jgi:hypothetical protein
MMADRVISSVTELRQQASDGLTFLHVVHATCSIRICVGHGPLRLSDVPDTWLTDYSTLFEVIVQKLQIQYNQV